MSDENNEKPYAGSDVYKAFGLTPTIKLQAAQITKGLLQAHMARLDTSLGFRTGIADMLPPSLTAKLTTDVLGISPLAKLTTGTLGATSLARLTTGTLGASSLAKLTTGIVGTDPLGTRQWALKATAPLWQTAGVSWRGAALKNLASPVSVTLDLYSDDLFKQLRRPLSPTISKRAEKLAPELLPANLQGFSEAEWDQLIAICTEDGIGLMWAPSVKHLRALLGEPDRSARYAYLMSHQDVILDEIDAGLTEVEQKDLEDLRNLAEAATACARAGRWEGALGLAAHVLNTSMEHHGVAWYRDEFKGITDADNVPITGVKGPGATIRWVLNTIPLPTRVVGVFELRAHLVVRPLSDAFRKSDSTQETFNRHLVAHRSSYDSFREEFVLPALLNMHALLRGLDEQMAGL